MSEVSGAAAKVSFADSQKMDFLNVFNLSFSKATLIDRFYQIQYLYFFTVFFIFLFLFLLKNKIKDKIASFFFTCLMILMILSTGIYFSFQIWPIKILYPMFREVGHFAPLIILLLIFSISTVIKKGKMKTVFFYFIIIFFVINLIQFYKYPHAINFSHVRSQFNDFEKNNKEDNSVYRILYYPFFGQYSISDVNVKTDNGFLLNNTGYDSFIKFSGKDFAHNPTASNFKNSIQYKLLKTYDIENLRKYNIKYIYDFSDIYESNYEKYVPSHVYDNNLSLIKNDKDFFNKLIKNNPGQLERINENILRVKDYAPRIFSLDNIFLLLNSDNEKYDISNFAKNILKKDFYYIASNDAANNNTTATFPVLSDIFKDVQKNSVKDGRVLDKNRLLNKNNLNFLYINEAKTSLYCLTDNDKIKFYTKHGNNLLINNKHLDIKNIKEEILFEDTLDANKKYYIYLGTQLILIQKDNEQNLGIIGKSDTQRLYSTNNKNFIPNASFQEGLWDKEVGDCNAYDNNPVLNMKIGITGNAFAGIEKLDSINSEENQYLQLEAIRHIACTTNEFLVQANADYLFSFDYQSPNAKNAGYYLQFNDLDKTTISERIFISDTNWNTFSKKIKTPVGATSARLYLYAYSADEKTNIINRYDNFSLLKLDLEKEIKIEYRPEFEKKEIELTGDNIFEYVDSYYDYKNIVPNGSFENGLWSETVGDCNNYDDNPKLAIKLINDSSDGKNSLQLEAERHIACADTVFAIKENTDYLLSFDFQSRNAEAAGYYLQFNNEYKTIISEIIDIENHDWQEFAKKIKTPIGADSARLYIYGYSKDKKTNIITRYDNFQFIELPDLEDRYFLVTEPKEKFVNPKSVEFELINPTKKKVH
ncbi:hypothetical protein KAJ61_01835, partial [Candidatus Parcubacteria bacterium]|nr:hypothetical protein [Candidatus Parcubacteria bacterium]